MSAAPCPECLHWARLLITTSNLDPDQRQAAIRELAAHLPKHTEGRAA